MTRANSWTTEEETFLKQNRSKVSYAAIAKVLGRTETAVKARAGVLKITESRSWPQEYLDELRRRYPHELTANIARDLGKGLSAVYGMAAKLGLEKSQAFRDSPEAQRLRRGDNVGANTRFKKGQKSWNKGLRGVTGLHPNTRRTQFKPGQRQGVAVNVYKPVGAERISKDGYVERKVNDDLPLQKRWKAVHRIVWEEANGPIPKGCAVIFKDKNKQNITLDNLELVTRQELMSRNTLHNLPEPIKAAIHVVAGFNRKLNKYAKEQTDRP